MWIDLTREQLQLLVKVLQHEMDTKADYPLFYKQVFCDIKEEIENKLGMSQAQSQVTDRQFLYDNMG